MSEEAAPVAPDRFSGPVGLTDDFEYQVDPAQARRELEQARHRRRGAPSGPSYRDRAFGCLLAGAVGDALGAGIEFSSIGDTRARFGPDGLTDYAEAYGRVGAITDDTQMTLFTLEGLIRAHLAGRAGGTASLPAEVHRAYLRWLHTQHEPVPAEVLTGWLIDESELYARRAPGDTCLAALRATAHHRPLGSVEHRLNDSKGCGAVMRAAPMALWPADVPAETFDHAAEVGALTHGHPSGYLAAAALAVIVRQLLHGHDLRTAVSQALSELAGTPEGNEVVEAINTGWALAQRGRPTPEAIAEHLGGGWTGEQALAIAVCAAFAARDLEDGLLIAVNHSGDSDSTGSVAGNILGALHGVNTIPARWLERLELRATIEQLTDDALTEFGDTPPEPTDAWLARYPTG